MLLQKLAGRSVMKKSCFKKSGVLDRTVGVSIVQISVFIKYIYNIRLQHIQYVDEIKIVKAVHVPCICVIQFIKCKMKNR